MYRVNALHKIDVRPQLLFAVQPPQDANAPQRRAVQEIERDLQDAGAKIASYRDPQQVIEFARA